MNAKLKEEFDKLATELVEKYGFMNAAYRNSPPNKYTVLASELKAWIDENFISRQELVEKVENMLSRRQAEPKVAYTEYQSGVIAGSRAAWKDVLSLINDKD